MSFLSPLFLIGAATAVVPIVLHLLRREPEPRVRFAAVKFLKHAPVEHTERRRLREWLLLALRVGAVTLLAVAFARPFLPTASAGASVRDTIVVLDVSASMSAPGIFERARDLAKGYVRRAQPGERVGVLALADGPRLVAPLSADHAAALSAIDSAAAGFGATRYRAGLEAAVQALAGNSGTVVVVSDLQESGWNAGSNVVVPGSVRVEVADAGAPSANLAVTSIRSDGDRLVASVRNSGDQPRETRAHLVLDGKNPADLPVTIGPRSAVDVAFDGSSRAASAAVSIDDATGIQADNVRYAVLARANRPQLMVVTDDGVLERDAFYVQQALKVEPVDGRAYRVVGVSPPQLSSLDASAISGNRALVLLSTRGLERRGREALAAAVRSGVGVLIAAGPSVDGEVVRDVLGRETPLQVEAPAEQTASVPRVLTSPDSRHPIFQTFPAGASSLGLAVFRRVSRIAGPVCQTLARFSTGETALIECAAGEGRGIVFGSDLNNQWNDFPLHPSFVPFLHEVVRYIGRNGSRDEYLVGEVPAGVPPVPGIVARKSAGATAREPLVAVNVDPQESDPVHLTVDEFRKAVVRASEGSGPMVRAVLDRQEDSQQLWQYALALMIVVLAFEGVVAGRTA